MHIVDVAEFYAPEGGGVKTYIDAKLDHAARHGGRVTVIAPGPDNRTEERPGGRILFVRAPAIPVDRRYHVFYRGAPVHALLDRLAPDVVEASSPFRAAGIVADWQGPAAARAVKSLVLHADPVAAHPQQWLRGIAPERVDRAFGWYWRYLARVAARHDCVIAGSRWFARRVATHSGVIADVIPLGVDCELFHPGRRDPTLRAALLRWLGLGPEARLLVGVGRHHPEKQWPMLFQAVGALGRATVGMVQIGDGFAGPTVARAAEAAGNVRLLGRIADRQLLARILASADAMVHGSSAETFGLVVSEGLAAGLPLVLPDAGGCTDAADPAFAERYAAGDAASAAAAIRRLLLRDRDTLRAAAIAARTTHISTPAEHFDRLFALYDEVRTPARAGAAA